MNDEFNFDKEEEKEFSTYSYSNDVETSSEDDNKKEWEKRYESSFYKKPTEKKKKKGAGSVFKFVVFALLFSIIGSLLGGYFSYKLAYDRFSKENTTSESSFTITPNDNLSTVSAVAETNLDSVVSVTTKTIVRGFLNMETEAQAMGSGFIVHKDGYIATNDHVIASLRSQTGYSFSDGYADEITVILNDGGQYPAEVLYSNSLIDFALLKIKTDKPLQTVKLGNSDEIKIGEPAIAIGNPLALEFHGTVTAGYISGLNRSLGEQMSGLIQTDASINQGNSGGPLLNSKGEVIGINTLKIGSAEGLGFSVPINSVKPIIEEVIKTGNFENVVLGIQSKINVDEYKAATGIDLDVEYGAIVTYVFEGSPADKAGIKKLDIITRIGDKEVHSIKDISKILMSYKLGDTTEVEVMTRDGSKVLELTFEKFKLPQN